MTDTTLAAFRPEARPQAAPLRPHARPDLTLAIAGETPANVAETAVEAEPLALDALALIGIFDKPHGATALLRTAQGDILNVQQGDTAGRLTITALNADGVHLSDGNGEQRVLQMPG